MKIYKISDILDSIEPVQHYIGIFEETPDPDIEWPHRHNIYSIVWFTQGKGLNVIDFEEYEICPQRIFTTNPRQIHNWEYSAETQGYFILMETSFAQQYNIDFSTPYQDIDKEEISFVETVLKKMLVEEDKQKQEIAISYFISLLKKGRTIYRSQDTLIFKYKKLLMENIHTDLPITAYAERLKTTPETLSELCKVQTGLSAKQLQLDMKITEAKRLLLYTSLNINEIAFKLGFEDNSYFAKIFRQKTSFSPTAFQKKYLKKS